MNVLVVGGAGYIGSHVVLDLIEAGHKPVVFDNMSTGREINLFEGIPFIKGDILDQDALAKVFETMDFDAVVHLAALKAAGDSMFEPETYGNHNITGSINLINACAKGGVKFFIFSSTAAVYGEPSYLPVDEKHPIEPTNFYGFTKNQIERHLAWFSQLRGLKHACLRYFNAAGYDVKGRVKGLEQNPKNLIPVVMEVAAGIREKMLLFGDDYETRDGTCIRDYIHVNDLARAHVAALEALAKTDENMTVNLGSEQGATVMEVIKAAEAVVGQSIAYEIVGRREGDPASLIASSQKAQHLLQWEAKHSDLETLIRTSWERYKP